MVRVLVVNNYPTRERVERLERCLRGNGAAVKSAAWGTVSSSLFNSCDGVVLSGSPEMLSEQKTQLKFRPEANAVLDSSVPVLGICFGHQLVAHAFGAEIVRDTKRVLRMVRTTVVDEDTIFSGLPRSLTLLESRSEVSKSLPDGFTLLAKSETSEVAAMKHRRRPIYGVQFHPERFTRANPDGDTVAANFVRMLG